MSKRNQTIDLISYIQDYLKLKPDTIIYIGSDSQVRGKFTHYAYVIVLYNERKGGHVLYAKETIIKIDWFNRLMREVNVSIQIGQMLMEKGIERPITIDIDLNPDPRWKSNSVLRSVLGWGEGMGFKTRYKPEAFCASYAADHLVKAK